MSFFPKIFIFSIVILIGCVLHSISPSANVGDKILSPSAELCSKFDGVLGGFADDMTEGVLNERSFQITTSSVYRDSQYLYLLFSLLRNHHERYSGIVKVEPTQSGPKTSLHVFTKCDSKSGGCYPPEVTSALAHLKIIKAQDDFVTSDPAYKHNNCSPLSGEMPGSMFSDKENRKFIRHYLNGKQSLAGICDDWAGRMPLIHYESDVPKAYILNDVPVYIDTDYVGVATNDEFQYVCGLNKSIRAKFIKTATIIKAPEGLQEFLNHYNLNKNLNISQSQDMWEGQVLRNIIEGQILYNNKSGEN